MKPLALRPIGLALVLLVAACSSGSERQPETSTVTTGTAPSAPMANQHDAPATNMAEPATATPAATASGKVIGLEGLGALRLGQAVPGGGSWAETNAETGDSCRTVTSPEYPGVYAIVSGDKVRRITVGQRSDVKLAEGIGVGATEGDVRKWFGGFRATPHKYEAAPAKYLTAPNASSGDPAVRFEIGEDGKVGMIHVGMMPELAYVEGCA